MYIFDKFKVEIAINKKESIKSSEFDLNLPPIKYEKEVVIAEPIIISVTEKPIESIIDSILLEPQKDAPKEGCFAKLKKIYNNNRCN